MEQSLVWESSIVKCEDWYENGKIYLKVLFVNDFPPREKGSSPHSLIILENASSESGKKDGMWSILRLLKSNEILCNSDSAVKEGVIFETIEGYLCINYQKDDYNSSIAKIRIAPRLALRSRLSIYDMIEIDTVNQSFRADLYSEIRIRGISKIYDIDFVKRVVIDMYEISQKTLRFLHVREIFGEEKDSEYMTETSDYSKGTFDYCFKRRFQASFTDRAELHDFPFDRQILKIRIQAYQPRNMVYFIPNAEYPSIFFYEKFQFHDTYKPVFKDKIYTCTSLSDSKESSAYFEYPICTYTLAFDRKPHYYITNIVAPMATFTLLACLSFAVDEDGNSMDIGTRLSFTMTLLLTAVAYKFVVTSALPQISYLTIMDKYVNMCFLFICAVLLENAVYPAVFQTSSGDERYVLVVYIGIFCLFNAIWVFVIFIKKYNANNRGNKIYDII